MATTGPVRVGRAALWPPPQPAHDQLPFPGVERQRRAASLPEFRQELWKKGQNGAWRSPVLAKSMPRTWTDEWPPSVKPVTRTAWLALKIQDRIKRTHMTSRSSGASVRKASAVAAYRCRSRPGGPLVKA